MFIARPRLCRRILHSMHQTSYPGNRAPLTRSTVYLGVNVTVAVISVDGTLHKVCDKWEVLKDEMGTDIASAKL